MHDAPSPAAALRPRRRAPRFVGGFALLAALALPLAACGGGGSGVGSGNGLVLLTFEQQGIDNLPLNTVLEIRFSGSVDPASVSAASVQVREGTAFGKTVPGVLIVSGSTIYFEPRLPGLCDLADGGFQPNMQYRLQVIGFPEEFSVRNPSGDPVGTTRTFEFHTRAETDPDRFVDQIPGLSPQVVSMTPAHGAEAVRIEDGNRIVLRMSENLDPCSINEETVLVRVFEMGDKDIMAPADGGTGNATGFATAAGLTADQTPGDPFSWSGGNMPGVSVLPEPQRVPVHVQLDQGFGGTQIVLTPRFGYSSDPRMNLSRFPENAFIVVQLAFGVTDFGGLPLTPYTASFTTENVAAQRSAYELATEGETPYLTDESTAEIDTARAPGRVQGYLLFAGDGDNGGEYETPGFPNGTNCDFRPNTGAKEHFDPTADVLLDTGSSVNPCSNSTDGSTAVVWEFATMRIRSGYTVRVVGKNPAIFLVQGDVVIENGAVLKARGTSGSDNGAGQNGGNYQGSNNGQSDRLGGQGVAGGGHGGISVRANQDHRYGDDGNAGFGSPDYDAAMARQQPGVSGSPLAPLGGGSAGQPQGAAASSPRDGSSAGGGGGGHAEDGADGGTNSGSNFSLKLASRSFGGDAYEAGINSSGRMQTPEAGSGGGAAGMANGRPWNTSTSYIASGGAGGAGGGFIDITSSGTISISGTIDVAGGRGGAGGGWVNYSAAAGGGGGSGGGVRLLTPNDIVLSPTATVTAAGGRGGKGVAPQAAPSGINDGGTGGNGRVVMETSNGIVTGLSGATVVPAEGAPGFYRGIFDATRFQGGGLQPAAVTDVFAVGPTNPTYLDPIAADFIAGVPTVGATGVGKTAILIEARGYQLNPNGSYDPATGTDWFSIGSFMDTGIENLPEWKLGHPADLVVPADNALDPASPQGDSGSGFPALNASGGGGFEFLQIRITVLLPDTVGPFDPGSFLDHWSIRFDHDQ